MPDFFKANEVGYAINNSQALALYSEIKTSSRDLAYT